MAIVCEESSSMMPFTPPEICKQHAIQLSINTRCPNKMIWVFEWQYKEIFKRILIKTKLPILIMVFRVVTSDSDVVFIHLTTWPHTQHGGGCPHGIMVKAMDCGIVVSEFVLQLRYYIHIRANTLGKGMNPLILPAMG